MSEASAESDKAEEAEAEAEAARLAANAGEAFLRYYAPKDEIQFFDPYLSVIGPPGRHGRVVGGYKLLPEEAPEGPVRRILSMGNSTSLLPYYPWAELLEEGLNEAGYGVEFWHGAGKGNTSSQELMRVVRDAPVIRPELIVSLSGICDIGYLLNAPQHPHLHKYARRIYNFARDSEMVTRSMVYGPPDEASPGAVWLRNQRMIRILADGLGIRALCFLQPVQGFGPYPQSEEERAVYAKKSKVVLAGADKPYGECVTEFYEEVRAGIAAEPAAFDHVVDLTGVFADCPGAYKDHRHQTEKGVAHLAARMLPHLKAQLDRTDPLRESIAQGGEDSGA